MYKKIQDFNWQIERIVPGNIPWYSGRVFQEHMYRYRFVKDIIKGKIIADIACGVGYGCMEMINCGAKKVIGIDNDEKAIKHAKDIYHHNRIIFMLRDAADTGLLSKSIDVVVSFETIEHVEKPDNLIKEIKRILKPGGILVISTPNKSMSIEDNPFHFKEYDLNEYKKLLSGFKNIKFYGQRKVNFPIIFSWVKKNKSLIPKNLHRLIYFRPWERLNIVPIQSSANNYMYYIAICRQK